MKTRKSRATKGEELRCEMRLDIPGHISSSLVALHDLQRICDAHRECNCHAKAIDLPKNPKLPAANQVWPAPALLPKLPPRPKKFIGDLTDAGRVLVGHALRPRELRS